ncbi:MAG: D-tyrosyl-tRNA(Tyr) deacylase [Rhodococcus sp.]|nr:D-tyrosyl-tRNA(Tyr) deacylase [Rhodococcus sp. (in: high G+C Gram-positive bacteria)]
MRAIVQRVSRASVTVDGQIVGQIQPNTQGLVVYVGVTHSDDRGRAHELARKVWTLRILNDHKSDDQASGDSASTAEKSASDIDAPLLVISQFTLYGDTVKGRRPSWSAAAPRAVAEPLVDEVVARLRELGATVETGRFGAHMYVESINDGPFTVSVEV